MIKYNFIIQYTCLSKNGEVLKEGKVRCKNKFNSFEAKCSFEKFMKNKYPNYGKLIIKTCTKEDSYTELLDYFNNLFKKTTTL